MLSAPKSSALLASTLLLSGCNELHGYATLEVNGTVYHADGSPAADTEVQLAFQAGGIYLASEVGQPGVVPMARLDRRVVTDSAGHYRAALYTRIAADGDPIALTAFAVTEDGGYAGLTERWYEGAVDYADVVDLAFIDAPDADVVDNALVVTWDARRAPRSWLHDDGLLSVASGSPLTVDGYLAPSAGASLTLSSFGDERVYQATTTVDSAPTPHTETPEPITVHLCGEATHLPAATDGDVTVGVLDAPVTCLELRSSAPRRWDRVLALGVVADGTPDALSHFSLAADDGSVATDTGLAGRPMSLRFVGLSNETDHVYLTADGTPISALTEVVVLQASPF